MTVLRIPTWWPLSLAALGLVAITSCRDPIGPADEAWIEPDTISLAVGEQLRLRALVRSPDGEERKVDADRWESGSSKVAVVGERSGVIEGVAAGFAPIEAFVDGQRLRAFAAVGEVTFRNVDSMVIAQYAAAAGHMGIRLTTPAIALDDRTIDGNIPRFPTRWTSTAYIGTRWYMFRVNPDGDIGAVYGHGGEALQPRGSQRVLVLIVDYGDTDIRDKIDLWVEAQDSVNGDHRALARTLGYADALVQFENTNVLVPKDSVSDPQDADSVLALAGRLGYDPDAFDVVVSIPMTPEIRGGHADTFRNVVVMGCTSCPVPGEDGIARLTRDALDKTARVIYHHEVGHLWGWRHEWGGGPTGTRIITQPVLFGWTDTDGDGVPEIRDPTPYGISPADTAGLGITG